jgi:hypothetical protein
MPYEIVMKNSGNRNSIKINVVIDETDATI